MNYFTVPKADQASMDLDAADSSLQHHRIINGKKFLKNTYRDFYRRFLEAAADVPDGGVRIEIGSGGGFIKEVVPEVLTSDVVRLQTFTDFTFSALKMPFENSKVSVFYLLNTFHHLHDIPTFLKECERCLMPGGKLVMIEPANTPWSRWVYTNFHHEPFDERGGWTTHGGRLSGGNQALPWIVFVRDRARFIQDFPSLTILKTEAHTPLRYLMSGGLKYPFSSPSVFYHPVSYIEKLMTPIHPHCGMFMTVVLRKT